MPRAADSQYVRSAAIPAPSPLVFVGVFTLHHPLTPVSVCFDGP